MMILADIYMNEIIPSALYFFIRCAPGHPLFISLHESHKQFQLRTFREIMTTKRNPFHSDLYLMTLGTSCTKTVNPKIHKREQMYLLLL